MRRTHIFETEAVRYRAGLFDVTSQRLIDATGKDALSALNELLTSDIAKLAPGKVGDQQYR